MARVMVEQRPWASRPDAVEVHADRHGVACLSQLHSVTEAVLRRSDSLVPAVSLPRYSSHAAAYQP